MSAGQPDQATAELEDALAAGLARYADAEKARRSGSGRDDAIARLRRAERYPEPYRRGEA